MALSFIERLQTQKKPVKKKAKKRSHFTLTTAINLKSKEDMLLVQDIDELAQHFGETRSSIMNLLLKVGMEVTQEQLLKRVKEGKPIDVIEEMAEKKPRRAGGRPLKHLPPKQKEEPETPPQQ